MDKKSGYILIGIGFIFAGILFLYSALRPGSTVIRVSEKESSVTQFSTERPQEDNEEDLIAESDSQSQTEIQISYPINLNTATANELSDLIPGIGDVLASRIVEYRELYGPYSSVDDLLIISGISETKLESIRDYITV